MPNRRGSAKNVVSLQVREGVAKVRETPTEVPASLAASPLYGVAMLKIAMELKKADAQPLDALITGVLQRMGLPEGEFRAYLSSNGGLLRTIAEKRGF